MNKLQCILLATLLISTTAAPAVAQKMPSLVPSWPLLDAAKVGDVDKAKRTIIAGDASPNQADGTDRTALMMAAAGGHAPLVKVLLELGAMPILKDKQGYTALHAAAENGYDDVVAILLKAGAPADDDDRTGVTPLMLAASAGSADCVKLLLAAGADPDRGDFGGRTARERAGFQRNKGVQRLLAEAPKR